MGEIVFVPTSDFNNYGSGDSSGFSINIIQTCKPYIVSIQIIGPYDDYDYQFYHAGKIPFCNGTITHDGSGEGVDGDIYEVCVGAPFVGGHNYDVYVNISGCSPCISEAHSFQADECASGNSIEVRYDCYWGLIVQYNCTGGGTCTEATLTKGVETVVLPLPVLPDSFTLLEDGDYTITIGTVSEDFTVACALTDISTVPFCTDLNEQGIVVSCKNKIGGVSYQLSVTDIDLATVVHVEDIISPEPPFIDLTKTPSETTTNFIIEEFNITPALETNNYSINIEHVGLNDRPHYGGFDSAIPDASDTVVTLDCEQIGDSGDIVITNIRCNSLGILVDIEALYRDNLTEDSWELLNEDKVPFYSGSDIYLGTNNKRTISIPWQGFGGCLTTHWCLRINYVGAYSGVVKYFYVSIPQICIADIMEDCFVNCPWVQYCTEDPQT